MDTVMNSLLYFVFAFIVGLGVDTLWRHVRVRIKLIEEAEREAQETEKSEMENVSKAKASAITRLFG